VLDKRRVQKKASCPAYRREPNQDEPHPECVSGSPETHQKSTQENQTRHRVDEVVDWAERLMLRVVRCPMVRGVDGVRLVEIVAANATAQPTAITAATMHNPARTRRIVIQSA
jgi:hypothetical protein